MAKAGKRKARVRAKDMKFKNLLLVRVYERTEEWLQQRGRPIVIAITVLAALIIVYLAGDYFFEYRKSKAGVAFAEAYEKYSAQVVDSPTTTQVSKYYTDEKQKWQESAEAFERLANEYSGYYKYIGRYYAGISYLHFDEARGIQLLEEVVAGGGPEMVDQARLALAEHYAVAGNTEKAKSYYESLLSSPVVPHQVSHMGLAKLYEGSNDTKKAIEEYFEAAKIDRETSQTSDAEKRLAALAPSRVKDLPPPASIEAIP